MKKSKTKGLPSLLGMMNPDMHIDQDKTQWLWRYMDASKFLSLVTKKSLFFPKASLFLDKREGLIHHPKTIGLMRAFNKLIEEKGSPPRVDLNKFQQHFRELMAISCWTKSPVESVALWNMYTSQTSGVCIRTNLSALSAELKGKVPVIHKKTVAYNDLGQTDSLKAFFRKTPEWKFETEYRFIISMLDSKNSKKSDGKYAPLVDDFFEHNGLYIPIDLKKVVKEVRVHYQAPNWILEDIKILVSTFVSPDIPINKSELNDEL